MDDFLKTYLTKYDRWIEKGKISHSSKVIPVEQSLTARQWVLPNVQILDILKNAKSIALQKCVCRNHYSRCEKPLETCFVLNGLGDKLIEKGEARKVGLDEALEVLKKTDEHGLVHMSLHMPDHEVFAVCSCCSCCCHDIQLLKLTARKDLVAHSEYVAQTDMDECIRCGACVERCPFDARSLDEGTLHYNPQSCLGCGLCVSVCPVEATSMRAVKSEA